MMAGSIHVSAHIEGMDEVLKRFRDPRVQAIAKKHMTDALIAVEGPAKLKAPVGVSGELRSQITHEVRPIGGDMEGVVGSPTIYAPHVEFGTGTQSDQPSGKGRHWPPAAALEVWAQRHGVKGGGKAVAYYIGRRGGLKPRKFLRGAWEETESRVIQHLERIVEDVRDFLRGGRLP